MEVHIRQAVQSDCEQMMDLINELAIFEKAPQEVTVTMDEFINSGFGINPVWHAFVAEVNGSIIGLSLCYIRYSTWKGRRLYLEDLIVTEQFRGQGVGKKLLDTTVQYAKDQNYSGMMWQVLAWNKPAIHFYEQYNANFDGEWVNVNVNFD